VVRRSRIKYLLATLSMPVSHSFWPLPPRSVSEGSFEPLASQGWHFLSTVAPRFVDGCTPCIALLRRLIGPTNLVRRSGSERSCDRGCVGQFVSSLRLDSPYRPAASLISCSLPASC